jgi:hypothetical protein
MFYITISLVRVEVETVERTLRRRLDGVPMVQAQASRLRH